MINEQRETPPSFFNRFWKRIGAAVHPQQQLKNAEAVLKKRLLQQELMSAISQSFISAEEIGTLLHNALMMTGMFLDVSHTVLARLEMETNKLCFEYEWYSPKHGIPQMPPRSYTFGIGEIAYDTFITRGDVYLAVDNVKGRPEFSKLLNPLGIKAFIFVPIYIYGKFWGLLGVDQCLKPQVWDENDIQLLRLIANAMAGLIIRINTEEELKRMSSIVNSSPQYISYITPNGQFKYFNQAVCDIAGYSRDELTEKGMSILFDDETNRRIRDELNPYTLEHHTNSVELSLIRKDGQTRIIDFSAFTMNEKKDALGVIGADITERRQMEKDLVAAKEAAEQSNLAKSNFLSRMSHEMRTPLNAVIGMTTIAQSSRDKAKMEYCLSKISEASIHLLGVINDILDMSKIEAGKFELSNTEFDFARMLGKVSNVMSFKIDEKAQHFIVQIEKDVPVRIIADEQRLAQVLTNLLSNAVKFTPEEGTITLAVKKLAEKDGTISLRFDVIDSGIGITKEQKGRLFTLFEQADGTVARKYGGTGLGLSISKSIVELMGGEIWVESEPGKGSDFAFQITVAQGESQNVVPVQDADYTDLKILAVDDAPEVLEYFKNFTDSLHIRCFTAPDGNEAYKIIEEAGEPFDMVFADYSMPIMDGIELTGKIKEKYGQKTAVIIISSTEWDIIKTEAKATGVDGFIPKPLFTSALKECISTHLPELRSAAGGEALETDDGIFAGRYILLAEDVEINREIVISLLEDTGVTIEYAKNGVEVVKMFEAAPSKYGLILMDIHMPEMDGYEATRRIRSSAVKEAKTIPIVAMTANVFKEDVEKCLKAGMNDHLGKPVDIDELMKCLKFYLLVKASATATA